jgi:hypothetical protein
MMLADNRVDFPIIKAHLLFDDLRPLSNAGSVSDQTALILTRMAFFAFCK